MIIKDASKFSVRRSLFKFSSRSKKFYLGLILVSSLSVIIIGSMGFGVSYGIKLHQTNKTGALKGLFTNVKKTGLRIIPNYISGKLSKTEHFYIDIKHMDYQKLRYNREVSLARGKILEDVKQEKYPATLSHNNRAYKVNLEMVGQNLDHINRPDKWSLKVRIRGDNAVIGMKEFTLLVPNARGSYHHSPVNEWVCHQIEKELGLITLRYDFVNVTINGKFLGVYALEEHFDERLLVNNDLREGIIFKPGLRDISVYNKNRVLSDPISKSQLNQLELLWRSFIVGDIPASHLFHIEKLAKRYAVADLVNGHHVHWLGNTMLYLNPITRLIEPIGREWESPYHQDLSLYVEEPIYDPIFHSKIFSDPNFMRAYIQELDKISKTEFLEDLFNKYDENLQKNIEILNRNYPAYQYSNDYLYENQKYIRSKLYPPSPVLISYLENVENNTLQLKCANLHSLPIQIVGLSFDNGDSFEPVQVKTLSGNSKDDYLKYEAYEFVIPNDIEIAASVLDNLKIQYNIVGIEEPRESLVFPWPSHEIDKYCQFPLVSENDYLDNEFIQFDRAADSVYIKKGRWKLTKNLVIPKGLKLICEEGTQLDLLNSSKILSYSPLVFIGTEDNPISISSSDSTGQGFIILNSGKRSVFKHVIFENLNNSRQNGWELTGCISFYESPVEFYDCRFSKNISGDDYLNIIRSKFIVSSCLFENSFADAIDVDFCKGHIVDTTFNSCGNDAVDASGSTIRFDNIIINGAGDKGLSVGESSTITANMIRIRNAEIAVACKDLAEIIVDDISITNCEIGFSAFQKKPEFGPGFIQATHINIENVNIPYLIEVASTLMSEGEKMIGTEKNVKDMLYGVVYGKSSKQ